jgi:type IV secretory pathway TraG/TraD family ATPase VirD4
LGKKLLSLSDDLQRRVFLLLDEFGTLQRLSSIKELLITSRSKGGSCWIGIQDIGQLNKLYTQDVTDTIVNACGTSVTFAVSDPRTAKYLIDKIGDTEILETEETLSMCVSNYRDGVSMTKRRKRQRLVIDSELMNLPDLQAYVKVPNNPSITLTKFNIKNYRMRTTPFIIRDNLMMNTAANNKPDPETAIVDTLQLQH